MRSHLKVKVFTLSAEMTYIRRQELKWKERARLARTKAKGTDHLEANFWSLRSHRDNLKVEARHTHLAYGALRGVSYARMEVMCYGQRKGYGSTEPDWKTIESMVERFSKDDHDPQGTMQRFAEWLAEAEKWYEGNKDRIALWEKGRPERIKQLNALKVPYKATA